MSSVKLSEMPIADSIVGDEKVPILQNSENKVALISNILSKINLSNYYTKTEVDDCLQVLSQSIDSINACVITLSGQIASLQNNISKL